MAKRNYESVSSIELFLKCPKAYKLSYIDDLKGETTEAVELGSWIHQQIERWVKGEETHPDSYPFIDALKDWLKQEELRITESEKEFKVWVKGYQFKGVIDAITDKGVALEFKVSSNPDNYKNKISYQVALYNYFLQDKKIVYVIFEVDKKTKQFKKLHIEYPVLSELLVKKRINELITAVDMINACRENIQFPPSFSGCQWCFYKKHCDEYLGG
jgi:hypothetical protein